MTIGGKAICGSSRDKRRRVWQIYSPCTTFVMWMTGCTARDWRSRPSPASTALPSTSTRSARSRTTSAARRCPGPPREPHLLCRQGELESGRPQNLGRSGIGLRHRQRRRTPARDGGGRRSGALRLRRAWARRRPRSAWPSAKESTRSTWRARRNWSVSTDVAARHKSGRRWPSGSIPTSTPTHMRRSPRAPTRTNSASPWTRPGPVRPRGTPSPPAAARHPDAHRIATDRGQAVRVGGAAGRAARAGTRRAPRPRVLQHRRRHRHRLRVRPRKRRADGGPLPQPKGRSLSNAMPLAWFPSCVRWV